MQLSEKMTARLVALLGEDAHEYVAKKNQPTYAALERRGLIEWGERRIGSSYRLLLTDEGRKVAEELRAEKAADQGREEAAPVHKREAGVTLCGQLGPDVTGTVTCEECREMLADPEQDDQADEDDYANVMFPAELSRVRAAYPVGTHVTGVNRRGERASGTVTGYVQSGSPRDGYRTGVEIEHADGTGAYTLINAEDVDAEIPAPALPRRSPGTHTGVQDAIDRHHATTKEQGMFATYTPRPRPTVEAVEVTTDNLAEIAELFGAEHEDGASRLAVDLPIGDGQVIRMGLGVGAVLVRHTDDRYSVSSTREFHTGWIADHS